MRFPVPPQRHFKRFAIEEYSNNYLLGEQDRIRMNRVWKKLKKIVINAE